MRWVVLDPDGTVAEQVCTEGKPPPAPEGGSVRRVSRFGDLARERFDARTGRWRRCPALCASAAATERERAQAWLEGLPPGVAALLAERAAEIVIARLNAGTQG